MKQKLFSIGCQLGLFAATALMTGCAKEFDNSSAAGEKPASVAEAERLASYGTLVTYIDAANFHLGNTLASAEFDERTAAASLTLSNFNDVVIPDLFVHSQQVDNEGNINMLLAASMAKDVCEKGINVFAPALCASTNINTTYLSQLIAPETVEEDEVTGYDVIDFEGDALGTTYPLMKATGDEGKGSAVVEDDPDAQSGHVVHVTKTNNSYVAITYQFPEGRKLGDYSELTLDYKAVNATALNQKIFFAMGGKNAEFKSPKDFGCEQNAWSRGLINIDFEALAFSDDQKGQTEVTVVLGPKLLNCDLINYWTVADCPVTSAADLIWKQNLGETYFAYAAQKMREQRGDAKLFVSEYLMDSDVRAELLHLLTANAAGMDQINGIDALVTIDAASFDANGFATMLKELAATGKLIRLTIQTVSGTDAEAGTALAQAVAAYKQQVPGAQQYGITFGAVVESAANAGLWSTALNRKSPYASLADALQ